MHVDFLGNLILSRLSFCEFPCLSNSSSVYNSRNREIKAQYLFEQETSRVKYPQFQDGSFKSNFKLALYDYLSLITTRSEQRVQTFPLNRSKFEWLALLFRTAVGTL